MKKFLLCCVIRGVMETKLKTLTVGQFRFSILDNMHVYRLWEEAGELRENPHRHSLQEHENYTQNSQTEPMTVLLRGGSANIILIILISYMIAH